MLSSPLGFNVQRNVKIKSIYQAIGILVGVCFNIYYITVRDVETAVCCSFSILFGSVGLYVDIQLLRGHWRVWPCILRRYMWLGIVGSVLSLAVLLGNLYSEMKNRRKLAIRLTYLRNVIFSVGFMVAVVPTLVCYPSMDI
ncbi:unnamed protein product [Schistosoma margrebowiei]|uniref:Uncharacterized protein n=1 Tax=Schistosoma margrebowiei TaxID=48269 RepID=A0AA85ADJ5_9TREM|nr:unnamed protein product [Schistosoma margrebowiei]